MTRKSADGASNLDRRTVYDHEDYKLAIRGRVAQLKVTRKSLTLRKLADRLSIQHTYLSRCLNGDKAHLSEDHIYSLGRLLDLLPDEIDHLLLLRSYACTGDVHRKETLYARLDAARKSRLGSGEKKEFRYEDLQAEAAYLFTPLAVIVHVALFIKEYRLNPRALCSLLGITADRLKEVLRILDQSDYIVIADKDPFQIVEVKSKYPHFGREHPLMRAHQATLKTLLQSRLQQTSESDKESFMVTFSMDEKGFGRVRDEFKKFVTQIQQISTEGQHHHVYQMSFDFLRWI